MVTSELFESEDTIICLGGRVPPPRCGGIGSTEAFDVCRFLDDDRDAVRRDLRAGAGRSNDTRKRRPATPTSAAAAPGRR